MDNNLYEEEQIKKSSKIVFISTFALIFLLIAVAICGAIYALSNIIAHSEDLISISESASGKYKVESYLINGGATTDYAVRSYLIVDGKKRKRVIYNDYHINDASIAWIDNDTININGHIIALPNGKYDFRYEK